ncbi:hypothetical protein L227DRAFT_617169, partial [Lentinus tigrinus ALCF2SS1-6]
MSLYEQALVAFSASGTITFRDEMVSGRVVPFGAPDRFQRVHVLIVECAKDYYGLVVSQLADGVVSADPPVTVANLLFPDSRVIFDIRQSVCTIYVTVEATWRFKLHFDVSHEFWEVARIISESMAVSAVYQEELTRLIWDAVLLHVPTHTVPMDVDAMDLTPLAKTPREHIGVQVGDDGL